jgi:hypothetical protein
MARRKGRAPLWVQWLIVWIVVSGLGVSGALFLRSRDVFGDAAFQPLAPLVCGPDARLETAYSSRTSLVNNRGQSTPNAGRQQVSTGLDSAACIAPDGTRDEARVRFTAVVLGLGGLAGAAFVGLLMLLPHR